MRFDIRRIGVRRICVGWKIKWIWGDIFWLKMKKEKKERKFNEIKWFENLSCFFWFLSKKIFIYDIYFFKVDSDSEDGFDCGKNFRGYR